ncbi:MAG: hypothetical protein HY808_08620 [Nitrospirae bacterium]|nr:hypothetical protein [Nitrospirota bacterium]
MNFVRLLPVILSLLLLGAHFFRAQIIILILLVLALLLILLIRRSWVPKLVQTALALGGIEWVRTLIAFVKMRQAEGVPWMRLALILGGVAAFTVCSGLVFRFRSLRERYQNHR